MKKLFLHLGLPKTGSTSFQYTCRQNINLLEKQNFIYPILNSSHISVKNNPEHHFMIHSLFMNKPETFISNILYSDGDIEGLNQYYLKTFTDTLESDKNVILSAEGIASLPVEKLEEFKNFLLKYDVEIIPIAVIRSPYSFNCSCMQQWIKVGIKNNISFVKQTEELDKIKKVFPNTYFESFKKVCTHPHGPTGFLLDFMGVDYADFHFISTQVGLSNTLTRVQSALNVFEPSSRNNQKNPKFLDVTGLDDKEAFPDKYFLTEEEYSLIKTECDAENTYIKEHFGEEFTDREIKFSHEDGTIKLCKVIINALTAQKDEQLENKETHNSTQYSLQEQPNNLQEQHSKLEERYSILQEHHNNLEQQYSNLQEHHTNLEERYNNLQGHHSNLEELHNTLHEQHTSLEKAYSSIEERYNTLQEQHNNLEESYNNLEERHFEISTDSTLFKCIKFNYQRYRILAEITFGKRKVRYKKKKQFYKNAILKLRQSEQSTTFTH